MQLVARHVIKPNHRFYREADRLSWLCKNLYNSANYIYRQNFFASQQTKALAVDRALKTSPDYKALPAKLAQSTIGLVLKAWTSYYLAVRNYHENPTKFKAAPQIPDCKGSRERKRQDRRFVVVFNCQAVSKRALKKGYARPSGTNIWLPSKVTSILEIRIVPKVAGYVVEVLYEKLEQPLQVNQRVAAIDLGLNNLATLTYNVPGLVPTIYDGRAVKSTNQYCNQVSSALKSLLPAQQKNSKKIAKLWHKRNCKVDYYFQRTSCTIIKELVDHQMGLLVIGWNHDFKDGINTGKIRNQNFACIPHCRFLQMLQYKGKLAGIQVVLVEESYTSKCSALDLEPIQQHSDYIGSRVKRGLFKTKTGRFINADVNGYLNIGKKAVGDGFIPNSIEGFVVNPVRLKVYKH
ncbi:transposase, IS605 OrfB family [Oscillatoria nigro-viridis PCC 7112]|uniref:Transposase, IS605 OrfB family n=1 Tax=Phormidium nigroviride PCC 7112 TaxID=179408 RepID=K9VF22_9CYAN|nr:RNA-guided endonuclease TnpB family protein [Oscillatoria nigro-viridis]AFZ05865.1 transposase, IS605 OrfB family [Oscillatoria nigro-viridis PCC 7112]